uniref:Uncharacterized protein n=1 Tax=Arundo donax TaxID=35708 RepID=A0A0A9F1C6_ARUDO
MACNLILSSAFSAESPVVSLCKRLYKATQQFNTTV